MTEPAYYDRLVRLACEMVDRVRDVDPQRNGGWWDTLTPMERRDLPWVLACMVDPHASISRTLGWTWALAQPSWRGAA